MKNEIKKEIERTFNDLKAALNLFNQEDIDRIPSNGGWSGGQCAEHIILATSGMPAVCNGRTETGDRPMDQKTEAIKNLFLDFNQKFKSPDFITPVKTEYNLKETHQLLEKNKSEMLLVAETHDLGLICKDFEIPGFGPFTKYEMLSFACIHTQRHTRQLKNIHHTLTV